MYSRTILVEQTDPELFAAIQAENARQEHHIELIASENYASPAVMAAQGSQLTNKYAEGYPGKRYYGGCEHVDVAEQLAINRVKQIFGADCADAPQCGCTLAASAPKSCLTRSIASCSATSTCSQPP